MKNYNNRILPERKLVLRYMIFRGIIFVKHAMRCGVIQPLIPFAYINPEINRVNKKKKKKFEKKTIFILLIEINDK